MAVSCHLVRTDRRFCPHCNKLLSYKTFRAHKRLYYDEFKDEWYQVSAEHQAAEHVAEDEIPPSVQELEQFSMDTEPSLCVDNDDLSSQSEESPPLSEAGFSGQSEGS